MVLIAIIVIVAIIVVVAVYYFFFTNHEPQDQNPKVPYLSSPSPEIQSSPSPEIQSSPSPEIINENGYRLFTPADIYTIEVEVKNNGGTGFVKVHAELNAYGESMEKTERILLENGDIRNIKFVFNLDPYTNTPSPTETFLPYPTNIPGATLPPPTPSPSPPPITFKTWALPD